MKFIKAERQSVNSVLATHEIHGATVIAEWNNVHPETGKRGDYDLFIGSIIADDEALCERIEGAFEAGESDENADADIYLHLRDAFDSHDAQELLFEGEIEYSCEYEEPCDNSFHIEVEATHLKTNSSVTFQVQLTDGEFRSDLGCWITTWDSGGDTCAEVYGFDTSEVTGAAEKFYANMTAEHATDFFIGSDEYDGIEVRDEPFMGSDRAYFIEREGVFYLVSYQRKFSEPLEQFDSLEEGLEWLESQAEAE
ncbi:MAG: hypothetical protein SVC26_06160 [Pseudomonadota bacterium]|nr:hypothetical protein [Pseudomonadota bacterium]